MAIPMLKQVLEDLLAGTALSEAQCAAVIHETVSDLNTCQLAAFLALMRAKGETVDEVMGVVRAMAELMVPIPLGDSRVLDIVGTGGDGAHTINISTGSALVAAAAGVRVAKHGNRAASSKCGAADVLAELGVTIEKDALTVVDELNALGISFIFAPSFHPAMKTIAPVRKALGFPTLFNMIGPLLNPARPQHYVMGVGRPQLIPLFTQAIQRITPGRSVVFNCGGLDELSPIGPCELTEMEAGSSRSYTIEPLDFGLARCGVEDLRGGEPALNARLLRDALAGERGPIAETLALNAGVAIYTFGLSQDIAGGVELAQTTIASGAALGLLQRWIGGA